MTNLQQVLLATLDDLALGDGLHATNLLTRIEIDLGVALEDRDPAATDDAFLKDIADSMRKFRPEIDLVAVIQCLKQHGVS